MDTANLFIVGAPRSGTTSMARYLDAHPVVQLARRKEPLYHARDLADPRAVRRLEDYEALFEPRDGVVFRLDASSWHLFSTAAAQSIAEMSPDARIIVQLRDPIEWIVSLHGHHLRIGLESEPDLSAAVFGPRQPDPSHFRVGLNYLAAARFGEQVARFLRRFPRDQIHVLRLADLRRDPRVTHLAALDFLRLDPLPLTEYPRYNPTKRARVESLVRVAERVERSGGRAGRSLAHRMNRWNWVESDIREVDIDSIRGQVLPHLTEDLSLLGRELGLDVTDWLIPSGR